MAGKWEGKIEDILSNYYVSPQKRALLTEHDSLDKTIHKKPIILEKSLVMCAKWEDSEVNVVDRLLNYGDKIKKRNEEKK